MIFTPHGKHLLAGEWKESTDKFLYQPVTGDAHETSNGGQAEVELACTAAENAFEVYQHTSRSARSDFLNAIADEIEARAETITDIGVRETGLPEARLNMERGRTVGQLRLFAAHILKGEYLDRRWDEALPDRAPLPRPDLRMIQRPIGPVVVFGSSNFPLAFSTAGGDTASALAAGCPVIVKGHPAHPGTGEIIAEAVHAAIQKTSMPAGVFGLIQGDTHELGGALVKHPLISAVGFTGSLKVGRILFDLCSSRPTPIPFFGELGSVNPMFLLPVAIKQRSAQIAEQWAASLTLGVGQFCTNPGLVIAIDSSETRDFVDSAAKALSKVDGQVMLTKGIAEAYRRGRNAIAAVEGIKEVIKSECQGQREAPSLYVASAKEWLANEVLSHEVFGPAGVILIVKDQTQMLDIAKSLNGQLTCTLIMEEEDTSLAKQLMPILERKAGRLLANGYPTGVEVCDSMVHGGPYPASTNFGATSVGTLAIRRFLRPVCYQNMPESLLPEDSLSI